MCKVNEEKKCVVCGNMIKNKRNKMFCSYKCAGLYKQNYAICPICGKTFKHSPSDTSTKTCGDAECSLKYRKFFMPHDISAAHAKISSSPTTGHFETHHAAVEWRLVSPDGELYEFKNLVLWAEQNVDLLPISSRTGEKVPPRTFVREIHRLKSKHEKRKHFRDNYFGWRVLTDNEEVAMRKYEFTGANELSKKALEVYSNSSFVFYKNGDTFFYADNSRDNFHELGSIEDVESFLMEFADED